MGVFSLYFSLFSNLLDEQISKRGKNNVFALLIEVVPTSLVLFIIAVICLGTSTLVIRKLRYRNSAVVVSRQGIEVSVAAVKTGVIRWCDIKEIKTVYNNKQKIFVIELWNPEIFTQQYNKSTRFFLYLSKKLGDESPIVFSPKSVKMKEGDLFNLMQSYHNRYK